MKIKLIIAITLAIISSAAHAEKLTIDPNKNCSSTTNLEAIKTGPDLRLTQKITYTSTDKRLHTVLEELSKKTGVHIQSGANPEDWPVRDIPVVVCVKDLPLGKLMRAIADATHLALTNSTVKGVKHYRIWRDTARQAQLANYYKEVEEAKRAVLSAQYDAWAKLKEKGLLNNTKVTLGGDQDATDLMRSTCEIMAALPEGSREAVISGKLVRFDIKSASPQLAQALREYYRVLAIYAKADYERRALATPPDSEYQPKPPHELTEAEIQGFKFMIGSMSSVYESMGSSIGPGLDGCENMLETRLDPRSIMKDGEFYSCQLFGDRPLHLTGDKTNLYRTPAFPATDFSAEFSKLDDIKDRILEKSFQIPKPKEASMRTFADSVVDIATASGFSIVCEDFHSHCMTSRSKAFTNYDKETTLKTLLLPSKNDWGRDPYTPYTSDYWSSATNWLADPATKMLIGTDPLWWVQHKSLAPAKTVSNLMTKLNDTWLDIDDAAPLLLMPRDQYLEWIAGHKDIGNCVHYSEHCGCMPLWKLYAGLSAENITLAKSKEGLPLAKLNKGEVLAAFADVAKQASEADIYQKMDKIGIWTKARPQLEKEVLAWYMATFPWEFSRSSATDNSTDRPDYSEQMKMELEAFPELKAAIEPPPTDPAKILQLKMRLTKVDIELTGIRSRYVPRGEGEKKPHSYSLTFTGNGINVEAGELGNCYPIYSQKRSKELLEAQKKADQKPVIPAQPPVIPAQAGIQKQ